MGIIGMEEGHCEMWRGVGGYMYGFVEVSGVERTDTVDRKRGTAKYRSREGRC